MKKFLLCAILLLLQILPSVAVPAYQKLKSFPQADGTTVQLRLVGDEFFHYYMTSDGYVVIRKDQTSFYYAQIAYDSLLCTNQLVHDPALRSTEEAEMLPTVATQEKVSSLWNRYFQEGQQRQLAKKMARQKAPSFFGKKKCLVLLVNFQDVKFSVSTTPHEFYDDFFNKEGYSELGMAGSVRDYFIAQSYGQFEMDFDIKGPVTVSKNEAYYGANTNDKTDSHPAEMVAEACKLTEADINFSDYDWDEDGEVDQVYVIYAGYAESSGADPNTIWPHASYLSHEAITLTVDGMKINQYACGSELTGTIGVTPEGIGTFCHEFSHCLGLMDMYDTSGGNNFGMGDWSLMATGNYNNNTCTPSAFTAFERWQCGWLQPTEITSTCEIRDMKPITDAPEAYVLYNENNRNEYYILENRQKKGWDAGQSGHGLTVMHIDYDKKAWTNNTLNVNKDHQRATLIPADNTLSKKTLSGDPFPGTSGKTSLGDTTTPAMTLFNENLDGTYFMGKPIDDIQESNEGLISFSCMRDIIPAPVVLAPERLSDTSFRISWEPVENATKYEVTMEEKKAKSDDPNDAIMITEDFSNCYSQLNGTDDIGNDLDNYLHTKGWSGTNLYTSPNLLKLGNGQDPSSFGTICTPTLNAPESGKATFVVKAKSINNNNLLDIKIVITCKGARFSSSFQCSRETIMTLNISGISDDFNVSIEPQGIGYLLGLTIYDGFIDNTQLKVAPEEDHVVKKMAIRSTRKKAKEQIYSCVEPSLELTNTNPTSTYCFHVRAITTKGNSQWSPEFTVESASSIESIPSHQNTILSDSYFDLQGRQIEKPSHPGIYIRKGKKVLY